MEIKNPYNLIKNINNNIDLILNKLEEFNLDLSNSNKEHVDTKKLINSLFEEYVNDKKKTESVNFKFFELIENLVNENYNNKKLITNLELKIFELENRIKSNHEQSVKVTSVLNNKFDSLRNDLVNNLNELSNNNFLLKDNSDKELVEINKLIEFQNQNLKISEDLINESLLHKELINNLGLKIGEFKKNIIDNQKSVVELNASLNEDLIRYFKEFSNLNSDNLKLVNNSFDKQLIAINKLKVSLKEFMDRQLQDYNFLKVSEDLINESLLHKKLINNLGLKISDLSDYIVSNHGELVDLNASLRDDFKVGREELGELNRSVVSNHGELVDLNMSMSNDLNNKYQQSNNNLNKLIESNHFSVNASKLFIQNYNLQKKYFFNNQENSLKDKLNTDILFKLCYFNNIKFLSYSPSENRILLKTKEGIILQTNNRFFTIMEVIGFDSYSVPQLYQFDDFVVFDIGMNRAYASLRFALYDNCSAVYSFEIDEATYKRGLENINFNPQLSKKINAFNFGLSNKDDYAKLFYLEGADGLNTIVPDLIDVQYEFKENNEKVQSKKVKIKKASDVISDIIETEKIDSNIVLKIDTEGSEYDIIDDLIESRLIYKVDLIIGEGHKFNNRDISDDLVNSGFKMIEKTDSDIVYSFAYVNKKFYDYWPLKE